MSKNRGGLEVPNVYLRNITLLGKWWSKLYSNEGNLWKQIILNKYYSGDSWREIGDLQCSSVLRVWLDIVGLGNINFEHSNIFNEGFKWCLGSGNKINFWKSIWLGNSPLFSSFPRLYKLSSIKDCYIRELYTIKDGSVSWNFKWRRRPQGRAASEELELLNLLTGISLQQAVNDKRSWIHDDSKEYTSAAAFSLV